MSAFDQAYWEARYREGSTGWDIGYASPQLVHYFDELSDKELKVLIPGVGYGHEAEYLIASGFRNVHVLDIVESPLLDLQKRVKSPFLHIHREDFFQHEDQYDLIIEQTFFCALHPSERERFVQKTYDLLKMRGKMAGLLWNVEMNTDRPPFGGSVEEYIRLFQHDFNIEVMEQANHSVLPRKGREVFFVIKKADHLKK